MLLIGDGCPVLTRNILRMYVDFAGRYAFRFVGCIYFDNSTAGVLSFLSWSERHRILTLRLPTSNAAQGESCILYARGI